MMDMSPRCENYHLLYPSSLRKLSLPYSLLVLAAAVAVWELDLGKGFKGESWERSEEWC